MIVSSWNVNSVRARIENIKEYIKKFSPDVLMMQEIKTPDDTYPYDDIKSLKYFLGNANGNSCEKMKEFLERNIGC